MPDGYDRALEHLASSLGFCLPGGVMVFLDSYTSFNDAAGGRDQGFIVVSGWVSSLMGWASFRGSWKTVLSEYKVPYFHMKEFSQSKGPFASWEGDEKRRARFLQSLVLAIRSNVEFGVASIVEFELFERINERYLLQEAVGVPYAFAGRTCIAHVHDYLRATHKDLPEIIHVFDDGDEGKEDLLRVVQKDGCAPPAFFPSRDRTAKDGTRVRGLLQLQAADFAAYEIRKAMRDDPREEWMPWEHRKSLQGLATIPAKWGRYKEADILRICERVPVRPRPRL